jgi:glutamate 5-kinase
MTSTDPPARPALTNTRRLVIKLGTRVLTHDDGRLALARLFSIVESVAELHAAGVELLLVSSGAVGLGRAALKLDHAPVELIERQACAAVGQTRLMGLYEDGFSRLGLLAAQVLLTQSDFDDRLRYLNLRSTLGRLLHFRVIPVINENDAVSTEELEVSGGGAPIFGDNDTLSALVATKLGADLLILLTDVDGVYERDPRADPSAPLINRVDLETLGSVDATSAAPLGAGRGGMRSKIEAATIAARSGCHAVIASGRCHDVLQRVLAGETVGTWFPAQDGLPARQRWIAFATAPRGTLHLDSGAVLALRDRGASLLAPGVKQIEGEFERGEVVELRGPEGGLIGRGMVHCSAADARRWCGGAPPEGVRNRHALVHRDHMVLETK